jgi:iron complex transport system substrate-binding protein
VTEARRIVSLLPSATEIVCALGLRSRLVGRSHECDHPDSVRDLPVCTSPRFDIHGTSRDIDRRVKDLVRDAMSLYEVDAERCAELGADLIITQTQCEVCAVSLTEVERAAAERLGEGARVVSLAAVDLAGILDDIAHVGASAGVEDAARGVIAALERRASHVRDAVADRSRPGVVALEWLDPLMSAGNWVPDLVEAAGGRCLHGSSGVHSGWLEWDALVASDPDVVVLMPCGFDMRRTREELGLLSRRKEWSTLRAVRDGSVFLTDGNQYFNRPGPRIIDSLELLAEILHPDACAWRYEGTGWIRAASTAG